MIKGIAKKDIFQPVNILIFLLALFALGYAGYRAYSLSFTHDESFTYLKFVRSSFSDIINLVPASPNDHIINTLLMKLETLFGTSQFILRFHGLVAYIVYMVFCYLILKRLNNKFLLLAGFILLNFNPYFFDFVFLARGYGSSHTFMIISVYYFFIYNDTKKQKYWILSLIFGLLSAYSVFIRIYYYVGLIIFYNLLLILEINTKNGIRQKLKLFLKKNTGTFIILISSVVMFWEPIRRIIKFKQIFAMGTTSFWHDTVKTLVQGSLYGKSYFSSDITFFSWFLVSIFFISALVLLTDYLVKRKITNAGLFLMLGLIACIVFVSQIHRHFSNGLYLTFRATLYYYPLVIIMIVLLLYQFQSFLKGIPVSILGLTLAGFMLYHFGNSVNTKYVPEWQYDCNTQLMLKEVYSDYHKNHSREKIKMAIHWTFEPTINFYRVTQPYEWLEEVTHDGFEHQADYYYIYQEDSAYLYKTGRKILKRYPVSGTILAKDTNTNKLKIFNYSK